jgi:hypothetical protein
MSTTTPPTHPTWAGVFKGQPPPSVPPSPSTPPAARLLQLYKDCVARGTWARLYFETKGGEEELSFSRRVGASTSRSAAEAAKKQGAKRPAGTGAAAVAGASVAGRSSSCGQEWQPRSEQQLTTGASAVNRSSNNQQEQQLQQEQELLMRWLPLQHQWMPLQQFQQLFSKKRK